MKRYDSEGDENPNGIFVRYADADKYIRGLIKRQIELNQKIEELESELYKFKFNDVMRRIG